MAIRGAIPMTNEAAFAYGIFMLGEVEPMRDFDRSTP
jgi:hypothetical protein